jgi:hypothetical protein
MSHSRRLNSDDDFENARKAANRAGEVLAELAGGFADALQQRTNERRNDAIVPVDDPSNAAVAEQRLAMRASDADRQTVADALNNAYADGRLTLPEHSERLDQVWAAKTVGELQPLLADLGPNQALAPMAGAWGYEGQLAMLGQPQPPMRLFAMFSGPERKGPWLVPEQIHCMTCMGGIVLDFREAVFTSMRVEITCHNLMGGVDIRVPDGVAVIDETFSFMGGTTAKRLTPADPNAPTIIIKGGSIMGGIEIKGGHSRRKRSY